MGERRSRGLAPYASGYQGIADGMAASEVSHPFAREKAKGWGTEQKQRRGAGVRLAPQLARCKTGTKRQGIDQIDTPIRKQMDSRLNKIKHLADNIL
jgi:hypothetical protein